MCSSPKKLVLFITHSALLLLALPWFNPSAACAATAQSNQHMNNSLHASQITALAAP